MRKIISIVLVVFLMSGMFTFSALADLEVVNVSNVEELLNSIASNRKIVLASGKYSINSVMTAENDKVPRNLLIHNIQNLEITGTDYPEIVVDCGDIPVIEIVSSSNITLNGIKVGHDVPEYSCDGGGDCVKIGWSNNIRINNCELYGCGIVGIRSNETADISAVNTIIRDCADKAAEFISPTGTIYFAQCRFLRNAYDEQYLSDSNPMIFIYSYNRDEIFEGIIFDNCCFTENHNDRFLDLGNLKGKSNVIGGNFENNAWEYPHVVIQKPRYDLYVNFTDQKPVIVDGRILVPVRSVFESTQLGQYNINWDEETKTAIISNESVTVKIPLNSNTIYKNDTPISIEVPAQIIGGRTMLPLRAVSEAFDLTINWDDAEREAHIMVQ